MPRITKTVVDHEEPSDKRRFIWDSDCIGFGLKIQPSGVKTFVFQYRTREGRSRRITLGKYCDTLTPDQARKMARDRQLEIYAGADPAGAKRAARNSITIAQLLDLYTESARFAEKAESTRASDEGRIRRHLKPLLGTQFPATMTTEAVRRAFAAIRDGKTAVDEKTDKKRGRAIVKGGEGAARMSVRLLRAVFSWAISEGLAGTNPAVAVDIGTDGERDIVLDSAKQYKELFKALDKMQAKAEIRAPVADAIRVIALTGARRGEIAGVRWRHIDLKRGVIELPPREHKTGRKIGKARIIGLPAAAQAIIAKQPAGESDDFVFEAAKGAGPLSLTKPWRVVREAAGLPDGIGLHGLRHSLASSMAMSGAQAAEIMTALGHRQLSTAQKYVHWSQDARAKLAERAAATVSAGLRHARKGRTINLPRRTPHAE